MPSKALPPNPVPRKLTDDRASFPVLRATALSLPPGPTPSTPAGIIWSPFGALAPTPLLPAPPPRCASCGAYLTAAALSPPPSPRCVFCGRAAAAAAARGERPAAADTVRCAAARALRPGGAARGALLVVVDQAGARAGGEALVLLEAVRAAQRAARGCRFALVTFGARVRVEALEGAAGGDAAMEVGDAEEVRRIGADAKMRFFAGAMDDVFVRGGGAGGKGAEKVAEMDAFLKRVVDRALGGKGGGGGGGGGGREAAVRDLGEDDAVLPADGLEPVSLDDSPVARVGLAGASGGGGEGGEEVPGSVVPPAMKDAADDEPRRLDLALEVALALMDGVVDPENSRVLTFMSGQPTLAPNVDMFAASSEDGLSDVVVGSRPIDASGRNGEAHSAMPRSASEFVSPSSRSAVLGGGGVIPRSASVRTPVSDSAELRRTASASGAAGAESDTWYATITSGFGLFGSVSAADGAQEGADVVDPENPGVSSPRNSLPPLSPNAIDRAGQTPLLTRAQKQAVDAAAAARSAELEKTFEDLGSRAAEARLALFFVSYAAPLGVGARLLHRAASRSRGGMVYAAPHGFPSAAALCKVAHHFGAGICTRPSLVSIRVSEPFCVSRVVGPAVPTAAPATYSVAGTDPDIGFAIELGRQGSASRGREGLSETGMSKETGNAGTLHDIGDSEDGTPVVDEVQAQGPADVVLQLTSTTRDSTRITTVRIPIASDYKGYLQTLDPETMSILLAKLAIADAGGVGSNSYKFASTLDAATKRLLSVKPPLVHVASMLYNLRRGPLVERHEGVGADEALVLRALFQRADNSLSALLMAPRVFSTSLGAAAMTEMSATSDAVADERCAVVIDAGTSVFVWVGAAAPSKVEHEVVLSAQDVAAGRGLAHVFVIRSGEEKDEEMLKAYLVPKHRETGESVHAGLMDVPQMSFVHYVAMLRRAMISSGSAARR